jgi:hypothetical protein
MRFASPSNRTRPDTLSPPAQESAAAGSRSGAA